MGRELRAARGTRLPTYRIDDDEWRAHGRPALAFHLESAAVLVVRAITSAERATELASNVLGARESWTADFGGEQFSLGRAFYTHLETGRAADYFANAAESDRLVEALLPGMQAFALDCLAAMVGGSVRRRHGFCGPGIHVFPAGGEVARKGGVVHFDLEGLTAHQIETKRRAQTLVIMLQPATSGGGLRVWDAIHDGRPDSERETRGLSATTVRSRAGDAVLIDSRRLHQIRPFAGDRDRISITVHAVEIDRDVWETWF